MDNRPIEYWFSILKEELLRRININQLSVEELKIEIDKFILWYNEVRFQKPLGWLSPLQYLYTK
ncbi:IS3 family transposase [Mycoplasmopsis agassizii]